MVHFVALVGAGVAAGVLSTVVGLASLVSYPALLLVGLPPVAANVTNTVGLVATGIGAVAGSRAELAGQGRLVVRLCGVSALGGAAGALVLLSTPARVFEVVVPGLIAGASVLVLVGPRLRRAPAVAASDAPSGDKPSGDKPSGDEPSGDKPAPLAGDPVRRSSGSRLRGYLAVAPVGLYGGYFGAAAGVLMLAVLTLLLADQPLARTNAAKNAAIGAANTAASAIFAVTGPVRWTAAAALAIGSLVGGWVGPAVVRRLPAGPLRVLIALGGIGLAVKLALDAGLP
jgi:uncharacterized membrane protein YfcA